MHSDQPAIHPAQASDKAHGMEHLKGLLCAAKSVAKPPTASLL